MYVHHIILDKVCLLNDVDFYGDDLGGACGNQPNEWKRVNPRECIELCRSTPGCTNFVWVPPDFRVDAVRKRCCLKALKADLIKRWGEVKGIVSGYASTSCGNKNLIRKYSPKTFAKYFTLIFLTGYNLIIH